MPNLDKHGRYDVSLSRYLPGDQDIIQKKERVIQARRYLELVEQQEAQELQMDRLRQEREVVKEQILEVDAEADYAITTADTAKFTAIATEETVYNRTGYVSVLGFASKLKMTLGRPIALSRRELSALGKSFSALCRERGLKIERVGDARYGTVNAYRETLLEEFKDWLLD